jgi:HEXXH motif-containing protein
MGLVIPHDERALAEVFDAYARKTARLLLTLDLRGVPVRLAEEVASVQRAFERAARADRAAIALLAHPALAVTVHTAAAALRASPERASAALCAVGPALSLDLALAGLLGDSTLTLDQPGDTLWSAAFAARVVWPEAPARVEFSSERLVASSRDGSTRAVRVRDGALFGDAALDAPFVPIVPGVSLALVDRNPHVEVQSHPEAPRNDVDLGGHPADAWVAALSDCFELVSVGLPALRREMAVMLRQVVPVGYLPVRHHSNSYAEAVGSVYMTLHPQARTLVEALVHEFQHNKLHALHHLDPLLDNAFRPLFRSPVRPDPRPLYGVLLAAHAFVPVAELFFALLDMGHPFARGGGFFERLRQVLAKNAEAVDTLSAHARPTARGRELMGELAELHASHQARAVQLPPR